MSDYIYYGPDRTLCEVLDEMRKLYKTYNFGAYPGLIEELQMLANRMEAHLSSERTYNKLRNKIREAKKELKDLEDKIKKKKKSKK